MIAIEKIIAVTTKDPMNSITTTSLYVANTSSEQNRDKTDFDGLQLSTHLRRFPAADCRSPLTPFNDINQRTPSAAAQR